MKSIIRNYWPAGIVIAVNVIIEFLTAPWIYEYKTLVEFNHTVYWVGCVVRWLVVIPAAIWGCRQNAKKRKAFERAARAHRVYLEAKASGRLGKEVIDWNKEVGE